MPRAVLLALAGTALTLEPAVAAEESPTGDAVGPAATVEPALAVEKSSAGDEAGAATIGSAPPAEHPAPDAPRTDWVDWNRVVRFDAGRVEGQREYSTAEACRSKPCVLTKEGAVRLDVGQPGRFDINLLLLHENRITVIDYFEKRGLRDYVLVERMFNRKRNKDVWSLTERLESGDLDTIYVYGVDLQYQLKEGDVIVLEMCERENPTNRRAYYFRFHKSGFRVRLDVALLVPIRAVTYPEPDPPYEVSKLNAAASISLTKNQDPEASYLLIERILMAGAPTLFLGVQTRTLEVPSVAPDTQFDLFFGLGLTYFDFVFAAWGANVIHEPHTSGLFFGVHIGKAFKFIRELNDSSPQKWDDYLEREAGRKIINP